MGFEIEWTLVAGWKTTVPGDYVSVRNEWDLLGDRGLLTTTALSGGKEFSSWEIASVTGSPAELRKGNFNQVIKDLAGFVYKGDENVYGPVVVGGSVNADDLSATGRVGLGTAKNNVYFEATADINFVHGDGIFDPVSDAVKELQQHYPDLPPNVIRELGM